MSTLIIRDLDDQLAAELKREAKKRDLSVNRFLRQIIEMALRGPHVLSSRGPAVMFCLCLPDPGGRLFQARPDGWSGACADGARLSPWNVRNFDIAALQ